MTEINEIIAIIKRQDADLTDEGALDDLVHETASLVASAINNGGYPKQLEYLLLCGIPKESILGAMGIKDDWIEL